MSLEHAILGFLSYQPQSGYDLKKQFDLSVQHFWPADQSQIYRALARLREVGWVELERVEQAGRPARKVHHLTPAGREELVRWLASDIDLTEIRSPALVQIFFAAKLSDEKALALFESLAEKTQRALARYREIPSHSKALTQGMPSPREKFFWTLTLEMGVHTMRSRLAWLEAVIARIQNGEIPMT